VPTSPTGTNEPSDRTVAIIDTAVAKQVIEDVFGNDLVMALLLEHGALSIHLPTLDALAEERPRQSVRVAVRDDRIVFVLDHTGWMAKAHNAHGVCLEAWFEPVQGEEDEA